MKKSFYLFNILIMCFYTTLSRQNSLSDNASPWTISFSYSPKIDISPWIYNLNDNYVSSFSIKADHRILTKFSYSFGVVYNNSIQKTWRLIFDAPGSEFSTKKTLILEFPLQLNYHLRAPDKNFDLYLMTSLNNSYSHQNYYGEVYHGLPSDGEFSIKKSKYCLFYDIGLGTNINLSSSFSIIAETSIGFGLVYYTQKYRFFEGLIGLRYTLK
jgi:hypothetical protein